MAEPARAVAAPAAPGAAPPALDDVMLAMDVVDQLRHADKLVERELSTDERDRQMKERLRQVYAAQGIEVSDRVLDEGVAALAEGRFAYDPPKGGRTLATLWVRRHRWGKAVLLGVAAVLIIAAGYYFGIQRPQEQRIAEQTQALTVGLPRDLAAELDRIRTVARDTEPVTAAERLVAEGLAATKAGDAAAARRKVDELRALRTTLEQAYTIRIVSGPGERSGVFRIPEANPNSRNYYLIVEAIGADDKPVSVRVTSQEDNRTAVVQKWGVRVSDGTYQRVAADKRDDGIIQQNVVGEKRRGFLRPEYSMPVTGGAILEW